MKSRILITPDTNLNYVTKAVINNDLICEKIYDSHFDNITLYNKIKDEIRTDTLINVSLFDDLLVLHGERFKILNMLSK